MSDTVPVFLVIEGNEIVYRGYSDISIAVASPRGLVVPVLRNCDALTFADVEKEIFELGVKVNRSQSPAIVTSPHQIASL